MDVLDLVAKLSLDSSEYDKGLSDVEQGASKFGKAAAVAKGVGVAAVAVTTATVAMGGAFAKSAGQVAEYGDHVDKMSQKLGISAEAYQEWDAILQHSGASIDSMKGAMKTLAKQAQSGAEEFKQLGISEEEVKNLSQEELFSKVIAGLQNMEEGTERTALATKLLGRGGTELGALLNTSAEETEKMRQRVHELGGVMSDEAVKAAARYQDSLQDMQTAFDGLKRKAMSDFLPAMADVMDGLGNLLSGDSETGLGQIKDGVSSFIQTMMDAIPRIIEVAGIIVSALGQAIIENLPRLLETGIQAIAQIAQGLGEAMPELIPAVVEAILTMVTALLDNIDLLIDAALQLGIGIALGLIEAIPTIIEKIPDIIVAIVSALVKAIPTIAKAGVKLFAGLVKSLPQIIASIVTAVPKITVQIAKKFLNALPSMVTVGKNLILGIGRGIVNGASSVIQRCIQVAKNIISAFKRALGISSPSKVMMEQGKFLDEGLALGITKNLSIPKKAMDSLSDIVSEPMGTNSEIDTSLSGAEVESVLSIPDQSFTTDANRDLTVILELDRMQLGKVIYNLNNEETQRVGVNLAGGFA